MDLFVRRAFVRRAFVAVAAALFLGLAGAAKAPPAGEEMTGVLDAVDVKAGTFTIRRVGVDVDDVLLEKMKQRERDVDHKQAPEANDAVTVSLAPRAEIHIKFRTSPSVANNVTRSLDDLRPMTGWPVTLKIARRGDGVVASEVIAWRGTSWKTAPGKAVR